MKHHHHHHHLSRNREGCWDTTDHFTNSSLHSSLFSTALWNLANSGPFHSLKLSPRPFCLPCRLPLFTVPCKMVLARPDERETCPYHFSFPLFAMVRRSSCRSSACWICAHSQRSPHPPPHPHHDYSHLWLLRCNNPDPDPENFSWKVHTLMGQTPPSPL